MHRKEKNKKKLWLVIMLPIFVSCFGFYLYVSDYYRSDFIAEDIMNAGLESGAIVDEGKWLAIMANVDAGDVSSSSTMEHGSGSDDVGFIFYPGAKVEYVSYLPLMEQISETGVYSYLVEMPFNLAFFGANMAEEIMEAHPEIEHWYMGGHSLGGALASSFASSHVDTIEGVVLLGAYLYGDYPVEQTITIYGSEDLVLDREKITYTENVFEIPGGNHALFGNYGAQEGDGTAEISGEEQQSITLELIKIWN